MMTTKAVMVQTTTVSMNGSSRATIPSLIGSSVLAAEWAIAADPTARRLGRFGALGAGMLDHVAGRQRTDGLRTADVDFIDGDMTDEASLISAMRRTRPDEVYNLAADMGGMGFIENFRVECLRSILINTHLIEAAYQRKRG